MTIPRTIPACYLSTTGLAAVKAAALVMRARLKARRLERDARDALTRPEPQLVIR